jgi:hypothetical protein
MFASLPKLADKNFVIGFLLPVLLAGVASVFLFRDTGPGQAVLKAFFVEKTLSDLTLVIVGVWSVSVLLVLFNYHIYRFLEGYEGPLRHWRAGLKRQRDDLDRTVRRLQADYDLMHREDAGVTDAIKDDYYQRWRIRNETFPNQARDVLPTRFGNAVRAFEGYSYKVHGVDSIPAWLRLQALIPKDFMATIGDARAQVDFFLNILTLALLIGAAATVRLGINLYIVQYCAFTDLYTVTYCIRHDWADVGFRWEFCVWIVLSLGLARGCYELAIDRAIAWGGLVKSAFDLWLPKLAEQLGHTLPDTNEARQAFWDTVNSQFLYGVPIPDEVAPNDWPGIPTAAQVPEVPPATEPEPEADPDPATGEE